MTLDHPEQLENRRAENLLSHTIQTEITLKRGVPILFFQTVFENRSHDHRLSVRFNAEKPIKESWSECHFSMAKRPQVSQVSSLPVAVGHEIVPQSYFCQRFFTVLGQIFFNRGLPEYRTQADHLEITLLRAVSYLSRGRLRTRGGGAGPWYATPEANCLGTTCSEYAWAFLGDFKDGEPGNEQIIEAYKLADLFEGRLLPFPVGNFGEARAQSFLSISNAALYVTATYIDKGKFYVRILNVTSSPQRAIVTITLPIISVGRVNYLGEDLQPVTLKREATDKQSFELNLDINELSTIVFELH